MTLYDKDEALDLTPKEKKALQSGHRRRVACAPDEASCRNKETSENTVMSKRNTFSELMEGVGAMKSHRKGKLTLRHYKVELAPIPRVDSKLIRDTRKRLRCSRAVFARKLRINERTLEKWEQGRAKPNPQAAALVLLVRKFPDMLERLERIASR